MQKNTVYIIIFSAVFISAVLLFLIKYLLLGIKRLKKMKTALFNELEKSDEERLNAKEEKYNASLVINNLNEGVLLLDKNDKILIANSEAEKLLGIKNENIYKKPILELGHLPESRPIIDSLPADLKKTYKKEIKTKENLFIEISVSPIKFRENNKGSLIVLRDKTRQKTSDSAKTEFVSLAAHQLRTPLTSIKWALKTLLEGGFGKLAKEQKDVLEKTYEKNESLIFLVNDLLDTKKIEKEGYASLKDLSNIASITQSVINSYKEQMARKKIKFKFKKPKKSLPKIMVDAGKIKIVIQNLLDNAVKYTPDKGKISIALKADKNEIIFQIKDSGIGIPENQQEKLFSEFFRGTNAVKEGTAGSGLGVFMAKKIVEAHGGKIWFNSKENKGTAFYFSLPVLD